MSLFRRNTLAVCSCLVSVAFTATCARAAAQDKFPAPLPRIAQRIDNATRIVLRGNTHPLANTANDRGAAPADLPAGRMLLLLQRSAQQEAELQTWLRAVQDPNSPQYRQWLTPDEFGRRFGVSDSDLATVRQWLQQQGFTVNRVSAGRVAIEFSGSFAQVQTAFHTSIHRYVVNGESHWANASDPQIPRALAPVVAGVVALHNFSPHSLAVRGPSGVFKPEHQRIEPQLTQGDTTNGYMLYVGPADAATIYNTPTALNTSHSGTLYDGTGITIGIAGDSNIDPQQNANYRATFGLPASATQVVVDGADPGENGDAIEAYLDTQVAGGIAPGANIVLYTAADTYLDPGLFLAIMRAVDSNAVDILNVSFGGCELAQGTAGNQYVYDIWQQAAAQGISVTVSSGDSGSAGCDNPNSETYAQYGLAVNALASTPYNIAVGGTDFDTLYSNFPGSFTQYVDVTNSKPNHRSALSYIPEEPWNDSTVPGYNGVLANNVPWSLTNYPNMQNIIAAGGGASSCVTVDGNNTCGGGYPVPSFQTSFAVGQSGRNLPDISLLAGNGLYGATWALCTDQDYISPTETQPDCVGTPSTGGNFNVTGVGGTSASAPAFAGILALAAQKNGGRLGQADYALYKLAKTKYSTVFHDLVAGNNSVSCWYNTPDCITAGHGSTFLSGFDTKTGYDQASGLGSVNSAQLLSNWTGAAATATTSALTLNGGTSALSITHGDAVAMQVDVNGSGGTPSGPVALVDNIDPATLPDSGAIGTFSLTSGSVSDTVHNLPGGTYQVTAHYGGDDTFAASDSNAISVTVNPENSTTDLKVRGYYDPRTGQSSSSPYYGFIYLLDAQPYGSSSSLSNPDGVATGTITFSAGASTLGSADIASNGVAELLTGSIPGGANTLSASFPGDASFKASTSSPLSFTVQPAQSSLVLSTDKDFYNPADSVVVTANFSDASGYSKFLDSIGLAPTGTVTFSEGSTQLGAGKVTGVNGTSSSLAAASASFTIKGLSKGTHAITATYSGDTNYASSTSNQPVYATIAAASTNVTLTPTAGAIKTNDVLQLTASMSTSGSLPAPTGTVYFAVVRTVDLMTQWTSPNTTVSNGSASVSVPANTLPVGQYQLIAYYNGDSIYDTASAMGTLQVDGSGTVPPTLNLTMPSAPVYQALPITLTVAGSSGGPVPTGTVIVSSSNASWTLTNGSVSFTAYHPWQPGPNTITVTYLGDSTYAAASATETFTEMAQGNLTITPWNPTVYVGNSLTITTAVATVAPLPQPTGTITISSGSYTSAATSLSGGTATVTIPANSLSVGSDTLNVAYSGDPYYQGVTLYDPVQVSSTPPGFSLMGDSMTLIAGGSHTSSVTLTPAGGFTGNVTLTAEITSAPANAVNKPTLSFGNTSPVNVTNANQPFTAGLTVTTTAPTNATLVPAPRPGAGWLGFGGSALACLLLLFNPRRKNWQRWLGMIALCIGLFGGVTACGGGSSGGGGGGPTGGTTPGTYTVTVTGTSSQVTATTTLTVTVQ